MKKLLLKSIVISMLLIVETSRKDDHNYKDLFFELQDKESIEITNYDNRYVCIRKYVKDGQLILHEIEENPKKINMIETNCDKIIQEFRLQAADAIASDKYLSAEQKDCVKSKFIEGKYFDSMAVAIALGQSTISPIKMYEELKKFIETMKEMTRNLNRCVIVS